jgi:mannonate dehydratase
LINSFTLETIRSPKRFSRGDPLMPELVRRRGMLLPNLSVSRRKLLQAMGLTVASASLPLAVAPGVFAEVHDRRDAAGGPNIALELSRTGSFFATGGVDEAGMKRLKQLGITHTIMGGPAIPWQEADLRALTDQLKAGEVTLGNMMIAGFPNTLYGKPGRDEEIEKVRQSIRVAGKVGLPVVEYNFYAHRLVEGYFGETGRGGAGWTAFDYDKVKDLPPLENEGVHNLDEMWKNVTYFLEAVIPVAEESGVRLALHPNDPPAPLSRGSQQILGTVAGWKKLVDIVPSKSNGITFDCGVTREMGEDPVEVCRHVGGKDVINHVHYRNVRVEKPYEKYVEVFIDEGMNDMYAIMKELVRQNYPRLVYPEHPRAIDYDRERTGFNPYYPGGGGYAAYAYNVGYTKAMLQAAQDS